LAGAGRRQLFLRVLYEGGDPYSTPKHQRGPLADTISNNQIYDEDWVDANTWLFIERFEQVVIRNFPLPDEGFDRGAADG
jgi:hypothetical protein